jgi:hypothetical protein
MDEVVDRTVTDPLVTVDAHTLTHTVSPTVAEQPRLENV